MSSALSIRPLLFSEIELTREMPPVEWKFDMPSFLRFHFNQPYFYVIVAETDKTIAGIGNLIVHQNAAWLGNIIVTPENRNKGIGLKLTENLIEFGKSRCASLVLVATALGEPLYKKLGFRTVSTYLFYTDGKTFSENPEVPVRALQEPDLAEILKLDAKVTGEKRDNFLKRYLEKGWVHFAGSREKIDGFYLPEMASGLIIAENEKAGLDLLKFRNQKQHEISVIPEENRLARNLLLANGYKEKLTIPRMVLGKEIPWKPKLIFSRATGYSG